MAEDVMLLFHSAWAPPVAVFESLARHFPEHEILIHSDEYDNHFHETFTLAEGQVAWTSDRCQCFDENATALSAEEIEAFGIEEAL
jgi:hypothetical protein